MKTVKMMIAAIAAIAAVPAATIAPAAPAQAEAPAPLTIESPIETLMANRKARVVMDKELPGLDKHPMYDTFKSMSLVRLQPLSSGQISEEKLATVKSALARAMSGK